MQAVDFAIAAAFYADRMKASQFIRSQTEAEWQVLHQSLRFCDAFTLRRCQVLLHSAQGQTRPKSLSPSVSLPKLSLVDWMTALTWPGMLGYF